MRPSLINDADLIFKILSQLIYGFSLIMSLCSWFACCLFFLPNQPLQIVFSRQCAHTAESPTIPDYPAQYWVWEWTLFFFLHGLFSCLHRMRPQLFLLRHSATLLPMHVCLLSSAACLTPTMLVCGHGSFCCRKLLFFLSCEVRWIIAEFYTIPKFMQKLG